LTQLKRETNFIPAVIDQDPLKKTGDLGLTNDQIQQIVDSDPNLKNTIFTTDLAQIPVIDEAISNLQQELARVTLFISLMPTEQIKKADEIRRLADESPTLSLVPDVFSDVLLDVVSQERAVLEKKLAEVQQEKQVVQQQLEQIRQQLSVFTGEPLGLSVFDILSIFLALFTVNIDDLYGLMNDESKDRFVKNTNVSDLAATQGLAPGQILSSATASNVALANLQDKVREYLALSVKFFTQASLKTAADRAKTTAAAQSSGTNQ
jgi:hypothetical protein